MNYCMLIYVEQDTTFYCPTWQQQTLCMLIDNVTLNKTFLLLRFLLPSSLFCSTQTDVVKSEWKSKGAYHVQPKIAIICYEKTLAKVEMSRVFKNKSKFICLYGSKLFIFCQIACPKIVSHSHQTVGSVLIMLIWGTDMLLLFISNMGKTVSKS